MSRKYILANTLTWHFIYFAKLMGFYPKIRMLYEEIGKVSKRLGVNFADEISFYNKKSFYNLADLFLRTGEVHFLNETFIKNVYFFGNYGHNEFSEEEMDELINLFFSYLKDKKIYKNVRIDRS